MESQKFYNPLNLPAYIWNGDQCDYDFYHITYVYSIDGVKLQQIVTPVDGPTTSTDYYGPMVLNDGELKKIRHSYGQMREIDGDFEPVFHIADHGSTALTINLGSPRVIFWDEDGDGVVREDEVLERIDAHPPAVAVHSLKGPPDLWFCSADSFTKLQCVNPFGLEHGRPVDHPEDMESHFRYTDQEHIPSGVPYYDYVSRLFDPALGRFLGVGDHAFNYLSVSPYAYVGNNPLVLTDPDGRDWVPILEEDGTIYYISEDDDSFETFVDQFGEEAAFEVFNNHCAGCFDKEVKYNKGDISLRGDLYPLVLRTAPTGRFLMRRTVARTDIQKIYNQLLFASDYGSHTGTGTFNFDDFFTNPQGGSVSSFDVEGPITTESGGHVPYGFIGYSPDLNTSNRPISNPKIDNIPGGIRYEYRAGSNNVPLLMTLRTRIR
jgi:RHS repeat-associated protein